jgi:hypothetical protein
MTNLCTKLEIDFLNTHNHTANITEYIPLGKLLCALKHLKVKTGNSSVQCQINTAVQVTDTRKEDTLPLYLC